MRARLLTSGELARELSISPRTVARYARDGLLKPAETTVGGHHRWDLEDVRKQMADLRDRDE
jgi:DNA-binding transcriptional MerR regulator